ncbi:MAG TPA: DUF3604 domain-containing protein [Bryobacteraceae bacterium]|nr:DUF3604 domain-containing protein [Bryobacteraceae bacterium]
MRRRILWLGVASIALVALVPRLRLTGFQRPETVIDLPEANAVIKLEFGLNGTQARQWTGELNASSGAILSTWGWHFLLPDRIVGKNGWDFSTRLFRAPNEKYGGQDTLPNGVAVLPNGVHVAVNAPEQAKFSVNTNHGNFSFALGELKRVGRLNFLDGDAAAIYLPATRALTRGRASQHDFPSACAIGEDVYVSWITFDNESNFVYLARRRGDKWNWYRVSQSWGDYYWTAIAADGAGGVHVVWSEYKNDRWRLVSRSLDTRTERWSPEQHVSADGRRQLFPRMVTDARGNVWATWQEFAGGNFEIFAASYSATGWSKAINISESSANDWNPAIAAAADGTIYIAWDGYERGSYNIYLRSIRDGRLGEMVQVTDSARFNAHVSVAVDQRSRVWLAWDESGPNWGKDWGVLGKPGTPLHISREIRLAVFENGRWLEPVQRLQQAVPAWMGGMNEYPELAVAPNGLIQVFFRHYLHRLPTTDDDPQLRFAGEKGDTAPWYEVVRQMWSLYAIGFNGAEWLPVRPVPESEGRCWMDTAVTQAGGKLVAFWPVDGRTYADPHLRSAQLRYADFETWDEPALAERMQAFAASGSSVPDAAPTERADLARIRAVRWGDKPPLRLFRGDLHRHTDISLGALKDGDIIDTYRYAIDAARLDFLGVTDHSFFVRQSYLQYDWWRSRQIASMFNNPEYFVTFFAYERTVSYPGGHRNIISTRRDLQLFPIADEEFYEVESYGTRLFPDLKEHGDIAIPHTTATSMGTDFRENDPQAEPVVEIFQGLRGSYEQKDGPANGRADRPAGFVQNAWAKGLKLGVIASSDHDSTHQSYACVYASDFTAGSIHEGLRKRRTFAATDNIIIKFEARARDGRSYTMGQEVAKDSNPEFYVEIQGTAPLVRLEMIGDNKVLLAREVNGASEKFTWRDNGSHTGAHYYYIRVVQANRQIAWSSPIWISKRSDN